MAVQTSAGAGQQLAGAPVAEYPAKATRGVKVLLGGIVLVIAPGILVSTDDLAIKTSTVKVDAPWGPEVPVRFRIDVAGRVSISTITARPPLPARQPRRTFWQWLLRRRPEQRALPPGQR